MECWIIHSMISWITNVNQHSFMSPPSHPPIAANEEITLSNPSNFLKYVMLSSSSSATDTEYFAHIYRSAVLCCPLQVCVPFAQLAPKWTLLPLKWALEEKQNIFSILLTKYAACLFLLNSRSANFLVVLSYKNWNERNMYIWKYFRPSWISRYFSQHS